MKSISSTQIARFLALFVILVLIIFFILVPKIGFAQNDGYTFLEPLPGLPSGSRTGLFVRYAKQVYSLILQGAAILGVLAIAYGGIQFITSGGSETGKSAARNRIINGVKGLLIIMGAYLILYTINPNILSFSLCIPNIGTRGVCGAPVHLPSQRTAYAPGTGGGGSVTARPSTASGNEAAVRAELAAAGITFSESSPGATQFGGLQRDTIDGIIKMKTDCGPSCVVNLSGGSEAGHAACVPKNRFLCHGEGYKVDVLPSTGFTSYFNGLKAPGGILRYVGDAHNSKGVVLGPMYQGTFNGGELQIINEGSHYDVLFN